MCTGKLQGCKDDGKKGVSIALKNDVVLSGYSQPARSSEMVRKLGDTKEAVKLKKWSCRACEYRKIDRYLFFGGGGYVRVGGGRGAGHTGTIIHPQNLCIVNR